MSLVDSVIKLLKAKEITKVSVIKCTHFHKGEKMHYIQTRDEKGRPTGIVKDNFSLVEIDGQTYQRDIFFNFLKEKVKDKQVYYNGDLIYKRIGVKGKLSQFIRFQLEDFLQYAKNNLEKSKTI